MSGFNEEFRFGGARWANHDEVLHAGLLDQPGPFLGFAGGRHLRLAGDAPLITFGGAGSGKLRDILAYNVCGFRIDGGWNIPPRMVLNDPRGELTAIAISNAIRFRRPFYCFNPFGLHGLPKHRVNPWDILRWDSPTFHADLKLLLADLIPLSLRGEDQYFSKRARELSGALVRTYVSKKPSSTTRDVISLPEFGDLINTIDDPSGWEQIAEQMLNMPDSDIRRIAAEMDYKRREAPKEYSGIVGSIYENIDFLSIPEVREALSGSDFSLDVLCQQDCTVSNVLPVEYQNILAPMQRAIFSTAMLYKFRKPSAPSVLFIVDEAAQLGNFEGLIRGYSYGRGMGARWWSFWQNPEQITRNLGPGALSTLIESSQSRQFVGTRSLETARMVSAMCGQQTLEFDAVLEQDAARRNAARVVSELLDGSDPFAAGLSYAQFSRAAEHRTKQARALIAQDEVLVMPETDQILFISGLGLPPIRAQKFPYFTRPEMAGAYLPNPYHRPNDRVAIAGHWRGWAPVRRERVPAHLAHWPQHQSGEWSYIEGYRPV